MYDIDGMGLEFGEFMGVAAYYMVCREIEQEMAPKNGTMDLKSIVKVANYFK
jgi:hypothetical protein